MWGWLGPSLALPSSPQNPDGMGHFCGVTCMGLHLPRSMTSTLWFWLPFWAGPGGWLGPWAVALEQQKSLTLMQKNRLFRILFWDPMLVCNCFWSDPGPFCGPLLFFSLVPPPAASLVEGSLPGVPMRGQDAPQTLNKTGIQHFFALVFGKILGPFLNPWAQKVSRALPGPWLGPMVVLA